MLTRATLVRIAGMIGDGSSKFNWSLLVRIVEHAKGHEHKDELAK